MGQYAIILGLGATGFSCVSHLVSRGDAVFVLDTRDKPPFASELQKKFPQVPYAFGDFDPALLDKATEVIVSPGVPLQDPFILAAKDKGICVIGDIECFARVNRKPVIAITGSNGKSTVTTLVGEMAKAAGVNAQVAGNIGVPVLNTIDDPNTALFIVELSSFHLEVTNSLKPLAATVLNVSEDHMDRYGCFAEYVCAKQHIYTNAQYIVANRDDMHTLPIDHAPTVTFGASNPQLGEFGLKKMEDEWFLALGEETLLPTNELKITGKHNWQNVLAALALGQAANFPLSTMLDAAKAFTGLPHRCQLIREEGGVRWYNDSKATNVGACLAAVDGLAENTEGNIILIAGGTGKGADFSPLCDVMGEPVRELVLLGEAAEEIKSVVLSGSYDKESIRSVSDMDGAVEKVDQLVKSEDAVNIHTVGDMREAVIKAQQLALPGDTVLLAPACASFDMFNNFEHRGDVYTDLVRNLK